MNWKQTSLAALLLGLIATLPACKPGKDATDTAPASATTQATLKFQALNVGKELGADQSVPPLTLFMPDDKIIASILTHEAAQDVPVSAKLIAMSNGQVLGELSRKVTTTGPAATNFEFPNPGPWALGRYQVEAAINGKFQARQDIEVRKDGPSKPPSKNAAPSTKPPSK